jgi:predicted RNA-binding protein YlqC (UPF0109 family)
VAAPEEKELPEEEVTEQDQTDPAGDAMDVAERSEEAAPAPDQEPDEPTVEAEATAAAEISSEAGDAPEDAAADSAEDPAETGEPASEDEDLNLGQERVLEFLSYVLVNLVEHPEDVKIDLVRRDSRDVYKVRVHEEDLGKVIGKGGQTARALRVMLTALSARTDQRIGLDIVE